MAAGVVAAAQIGKNAAGLPALQDEFSLGLATAAWFLSVISLVGAIGGAWLGVVGQRIGFPRQVQSGLLLILLMNLVGAAAQDVPLLMVTRVGEGLGFAFVVLATPSLLTTVTAPVNHRLVIGAWGAYMPVGAGFGTLLVPAVIPMTGWRGIWLVAAAVTAIVLAAVISSVPAALADAVPRRGSVRTALRSKGVLYLTIVFTAYAGQYLAVVGLLPTMLVRDGALSVTAAGVVTGVVFVVNAPGNLVGAVLQQRGVPRPVLLVVGSACMGGSVWFLQDDGMPLSVRIGAAVVFSVTAGLVPSAAFGGVAALTAGTRALGPAMGLLMQGSNLGQLLVPPLVAAAGAKGWSTPGVLTGLAASAVVSAWLYRRVDPVTR